jgi:thioredoxin 1
VISSKTPVLIHFWASWSIPDRELSPIVEALAKEYAGKIKVGRVDFDENAKLKEKFNVHAVPEIIVIKNGVEQERVIGTTSTENLKIVLNKYTDNP